MATYLLSCTNVYFRNGKYRNNCSLTYNTIIVTYVLNVFERTAYNFPYKPQENGLVTHNQGTYIGYCFSTYDNRKIKLCRERTETACCRYDASKSPTDNLGAYSTCHSKSRSRWGSSCMREDPHFIPNLWGRNAESCAASTHSSRDLSRHVLRIL
jgi:hypothetical protein